jgi:hypothetical protein
VIVPYGQDAQQASRGGTGPTRAETGKKFCNKSTKSDVLALREEVVGCVEEKKGLCLESQKEDL